VERDGVDVRFPDGQLDAGEAERERSRRSSVASAADRRLGRETLTTDRPPKFRSAHRRPGSGWEGHHTADHSTGAHDHELRISALEIVADKARHIRERRRRQKSEVPTFSCSNVDSCRETRDVFLRNWHDLRHCHGYSPACPGSERLAARISPATNTLGMSAIVDRIRADIAALVELDTALLDHSGPP